MLKTCPAWWLELLRYGPLFNEIRDDRGYQMVLRSTEVKFQNDRENILAWLNERKAGTASMN